MKLVTGGLGFIGNELVRQLARDGEVAIIDNNTRVAPDIADIMKVPRFGVDILDYKALAKCFHEVKPDTVFHLAALHYIPECNSDPQRAIRMNVEGTSAVLRAAVESNVSHLLFASSGAIYADSALPLTENSIVAPVDIYGWSKWFGEELCRWYSNEYGLKVTICRLFNNFGPRETNAHILPEIISQLRRGDDLHLGNIEPRRDYIYTSDTAHAFRRLATRLGTEAVAVNVASGNHASVNELIVRMGTILGRDINVVKDPARFRRTDKMVQVANIDRLIAMTAWEPEVNLDSGLRALLKFENLL